VGTRDLVAAQPPPEPARPTTLRRLVEERLGDRATVVAASQLELPLAHLNAFAVFDDVDTARAAIRKLEPKIQADEDLGFVSVSRTSRSEGAVVDANDGVAPLAAQPVVIGAVIGAGPALPAGSARFDEVLDARTQPAGIGDRCSADVVVEVGVHLEAVLEPTPDPFGDDP
jgi:hypothetical protein